MGMRENLKIPLSMLSINFLEKLKYKGSYEGKRFIFEKAIDENEKKILKVYIYKDLYNFENTKKEDMTIKDFTYDKDGIEKGIDFVESFIIK